MEHENEMADVAVTQDGTKIISSDEHGNIKIWDVETHKLVEEWIHPERWPKIAISPDDRLIAVGDQAVAIYTMEGRQVNDSAFGFGRGAVLSMSFSPDGDKLACGTDDDIRVYHVDTGTLLIDPLWGHQHWINCVLWSRDSRELFSGSDDHTIRRWNSRTGKKIGRPWTSHTGFIRSLCLSPDGWILASASRDKTVRFWNANTGKPIRQYLQHDNPLHTVRFSPSGEFVASAGWDGKIYVWRVPWLNSASHQVIDLFRSVLKPALILCRFSYLELSLTYAAIKFAYTFPSVSPSDLLYPCILANS